MLCASVCSAVYGAVWGPLSPRAVLTRPSLVLLPAHGVWMPPRVGGSGPHHRDRRSHHHPELLKRRPLDAGDVRSSNPSVELHPLTSVSRRQPAQATCFEHRAFWSRRGRYCAAMTSLIARWSLASASAALIDELPKCSRDCPGIQDRAADEGCPRTAAAHADEHPAPSRRSTGHASATCLGSRDGGCWRHSSRMRDVSPHEQAIQT